MLEREFERQAPFGRLIWRSVIEAFVAIPTTVARKAVKLEALFPRHCPQRREQRSASP